MTAHPPVDCARFTAHLGDYLEGDLPLPARVAHEAHRARCATCDALVHDLQRIADQAAALPPIDPPAALWQNIEARLAPRGSMDTEPSAPTATTPAAAAPSAHTPAHRVPHARHLAAAALLLVTLSAGITWTIARAGAGAGSAGDAPAQRATIARTDAGGAAGGDARFADATAAGAPRAGAATPARGETDARAVATTDATTAAHAVPHTAPITRTRTTPSAATVANGRADAPTTTGGDTPAAAPSAPRTVLASHATPDAAHAIDSTRAAELALLRAAADERLAGLDDATIEVVRRNLAIIDAAIAESRAALARDPASRLLLDQLDRAYERKVDLLRRLVLL